MSLLNELFAPIPLAALAIAVFALVFFWLFSKCFRMPEDFEDKETVREEIRYRLFDQAQNDDGGEGGNAGATGGEDTPGDGAEEKAVGDAPGGKEPKPGKKP